MTVRDHCIDAPYGEGPTFALVVTDARLPDLPRVRQHRQRLAVLAQRSSTRSTSIAAHPPDLTARAATPGLPLPSSRITGSKYSYVARARRRLGRLRRFRSVAPVTALEPAINASARNLARAADLVLAETPAVAAYLLSQGVPDSRIWLWVTETAAYAPDEPVLSQPWHDVSRRVRGLVTDSVLSQDRLEVELGQVGVRPRIVAWAASAGPAQQQVTGQQAKPDPNDATPELNPCTDDVARHLEGLDKRQFPTIESWGPDTPVRRAPPRPEQPDESQAISELRAWSVEPRALSSVHEPRRVAVVGFDQRFFHELGRELAASHDVHLSVDEWSKPGQPSPRTLETIANNDVLIAEWARQNAALLSRQKRAGQFLIVRLHRFEIDSGYPKDIDIDAVDAVVHVGPHLGVRIRDELGWPEEKLVYLPNYVNLQAFARPKSTQARFTLGMLGASPRLKRLDLALDLIASVRAHDKRFQLRIKTSPPWANPWFAKDEATRRHWRDCANRIASDPLLMGAVHFDRAGADVPRWLCDVGQVLSLSDIESFHVALAEGMASGAVPVIRPWAGAEQLWDRRWFAEELNTAAEHVLSRAELSTWMSDSTAASAEVWARYDPTLVATGWSLLVAGNVSAARDFSRSLASNTL